MTVYVSRSGGAGTPVTGVYSIPQPGIAEEAIDDGHADVVAYRSQRKPRPLLTIYNAILALTGPQKLAIGADLFGASQKWAENVGINRAGMGVIYLITQLGLNATQTNLAKTMGAAMYVQDNPKYLLNPSFDPTINIPGDESA